MPADPVLEFAETLTAFANGRGGSFTVSATQPEQVLEQILQGALRSSPPLVIPIPNIRRERGRAVINVTIPPGLPHVYSVEGRYLIRENERNTPLLPARLRRLMLERGEMTFEDEVVHGANESDLDWNAVEQYAERLRVSNTRELLIRRGCLRELEGKYKPTQAGMLLFGRDPVRFIRGAFITAVRFAGREMGDVFTRIEITGALPEQIRRAETFLIDHLRKDVQLTGSMERQERYELPLESAREALVNAVAHRDYSIQGDGIRLYLFGDRLEVTSPGRLPGPVTLSNLVDERFSRNSIIVQVLADLGFIERLGYGIDRILTLSRENSLPTPEFDETDGGFRIRLYSSESVNYAAPAFDYTGLNPRQQQALEFLLRHNTITNRQYQELCPDVHSETLRRDLADLVTREMIERLGEKRGSYYVLVRRG